MEVNAQEFGRLEGKVEALKERVEANSDKLDAIHEYVTKQKGAAHAVQLVGMAIAGFIGWIVSIFVGK